jgi:antibiotic biosynthesis monooxygenase (ABM) superfamily enzyme
MAVAPDLLVVSVSVAREVEADWNRWYDEVHLPEIAACPGFLSAQRYVTGEGAARRYLTIYELEGPGAVDSAEFAARRGWGPFAHQVRFETARYARVQPAQVA